MHCKGSFNKNSQTPKAYSFSTVPPQLIFPPPRPSSPAAKAIPGPKEPSTPPPRPIAKAVTGPKEPPGPPPKSGEVLPYLNDGEYGLYIPK